MNCINCGKEISDDSKFCIYCGAENIKKESTMDFIESNVVIEKNDTVVCVPDKIIDFEKVETKRKKGLGVFFAIVIAAFVMVLFFVRSSVKENKAISTVQNGYFGIYTNTTVKEVLDNYYGSNYKNSDWEYRKTDTGTKCVVVKYTDDELESVSISFEMLDKNCFKIFEIEDPFAGVDTKDQFNISVWLNVLCINKLEDSEFSEMLEVLDSIPSCTVLYGASESYEGDRKRIYELDTNVSLNSDLEKGVLEGLDYIYAKNNGANNFSEYGNEEKEETVGAYIVPKEQNPVKTNITEEELWELLYNQPVYACEENVYPIEYMDDSWLCATLYNNSTIDIRDVTVAYLAWDQNGLPLLLKNNAFEKNYELKCNYSGINLLNGTYYREKTGARADIIPSDINVVLSAVFSYTTFDGETIYNPYYENWSSMYNGVKIDPKMNEDTYEEFPSESSNELDESDYSNEDSIQKFIENIDENGILELVRRYENAPMIEIEGYEDNIMTVHLYEVVENDGESYIATWDWLYINTDTLIAEDIAGNTINLLNYAN